MASIKKFEDLKAWQEARILCKKVHALTLNQEFSRDYSLKDQIKRSSGSVMDNIAEGFDRDGNKELIHFCSIAKASCSEVKSQLYRAIDYKYISEKEFKVAVEQASKTSALIGGFMRYVKSSDYKGAKFMAREDGVEYFRKGEENE